MDETFSMLNKELKEKKENVAKLQKQTRTTEFKKILSTIKNLENNLDKVFLILYLIINCSLFFFRLL